MKNSYIYFLFSIPFILTKCDPDLKNHYNWNFYLVTPNGTKKTDNETTAGPVLHEETQVLKRRGSLKNDGATEVPDPTFIWNFGNTQTFYTGDKINGKQEGLSEPTSNRLRKCIWNDGSTYSWIIRNPSSGYVIGFNRTKAVVQKYTGEQSQIWRVKPIENWKYLIISYHEKALEINGDAKQGSRLALGALRGEKGNGKQQWIINTDNTISSAAAALVIDIELKKLDPGELMIHPKHKEWNQIFVFECVQE